MASIWDVFGKTKKLIISEQNGKELLRLDASIREVHNLKSRSTNFPVEDGSVIGDHIIKQPEQFQINGVVTDTPITLLGTAIGNVSGLVGDQIDNPAGALITGGLGIGGSYLSNELIGSGKKRSVEAYQVLKAMRDKGILLSIQNNLTVYTSMVLENFSCTQTARNSKSLTFTGMFKRINIVESQTVTLPSTAVNENKQGFASQVKDGNKPPGVPSADVATEGSVFSRIYDSIF